MADLNGFYYDETAEASTSYDPIPAGDYRAKIVELERVPFSKREEKGHALKVTWKIEGGPFDGRLVWQRIGLWFDGPEKEPGKTVFIANQQFAAIREATGVKTPQQPEELQERPCIIKVVIKTDPTGPYQPSNEVKGVKAIGGTAPAPANAPAARQAAPASSPASTGGSAPWRKSG